MYSSRPHPTTGRDILILFRSGGQDVPIESLKSLGNQLSLKSGEVSLSLQDARLILAKEWLELSPGAQDIFVLLERRQQPSVEATCLSLLASLLTLTTQHFVYQSLGHPIVNNLFTPRWVRKLNSHLSGGHLELCLSSLKLLNAVSNFASGEEQKGLLEAFPWDVKTFKKLLNMRRKGKRAAEDPFARPDIRTLCLQLVLSFLSSSPHVKAVFLEQYRDVFMSIFKGIGDDPYPVVSHTLETLWTKVWQDQRLRKTLKVGLFGEKNIQHLLKLYDRSTREGLGLDNVPADIVHHFLLAICTHRGVGICFADNGWYPRQDDESITLGREDRIHNKILANVLKMLKVGDDARQQELALKILHACPELVSGYLQFLSPMLEPRLSSGWLTNTAFYSSVMSLPVPFESFHLPANLSSQSKAQSTYRPVPPSLPTVVNNIFPSTVLKAYLTKALRSSHALIQHAAALLLAQCLSKYESVQDAFRVVKLALEEDDMEGQWARRLTEVEREVRKRVPDVTVIIALSAPQQATSERTIKSALLAELSHRLLWLYHRCIPSLVVEARYDVAKSLRSIVCIDDNSGSKEILGLRRLQQLHILRMLTESDQFIWHTKSVSSGPSNLYILLNLFLATEHASVRQAVSTLLVRALRDSLLFQHDPEELRIWLDALPATVRATNACTHDGVRLGDEKQCTISFLEMCVLRCSKTPHRYLEGLETFATSSNDLSSSLSISPVLITVLEQLDAKIRSKTIDPSDALSLTTFIRDVIVRLAGKQSRVGPLHEIALNLRSLVTDDGAFAESPSIAAALHSECNILDNCLAWCSSASWAAPHNLGTSPPQAVLDFITQADQPEREENQVVTLAYELVDRIRLVNRPLSLNVVNHVASAIKQLHVPALTSLCLHLVPGSGSMWRLADEDVSSWAPLEYILLHLDSDAQKGPRYTSILQSALRKERHTLHQYKSFLGFLIHRLQDLRRQDIVVHALEVLNVLLENAKQELPDQQFTALKSFALFERQGIRQLACAWHVSHLTTSGLNRLLDTMFDAKSDSDCQLVSPICEYWVTTTSQSLEDATWESLSGSCIWIKFMSQDGLFAVTESLFRALHTHSADIKAELLSFVDALLSRLSECDCSNRWLNSHLTSISSLCKILPKNDNLDKVLLRSVDASLLFVCGSSQPDTTRLTLQRSVSDAEVFWASRQLASPGIVPDSPWLFGSDWSIYRSNAVASIIYRSQPVRRSFWLWVTSSTLNTKPPLHRLAPALIAVLDCTESNELLESSGQSFLKTLFSTLTREFCNATPEGDVPLYGCCLTEMIKHFPTLRNEFLNELTENVESLSPSTLHFASLNLIWPFLEICAESTQPTVDTIIAHALQWAVRHLSETPRSDGLNGHYLDKITKTVCLRKSIAAHYSEPIVGMAIRRHLCHTLSMHLVEALLERTNLTPTTINRHLQGLLQHTDFFKLAASDPLCPERKAIAAVLYMLFSAYPSYTCQPANLRPLVQLYSGSLATADRRLLAIFNLFEEHRGMQTGSIFTRWPHSKSNNQGTILDSVLSLDPNRVLRTFMSFSDRRSLNVRDEVVESRTADSLVYDPIFIILLFSSTLSQCPPRTDLSWVSLYRTNVTSLVIRCLSSTDGAVRKVSLLQLGTLYKLMKTADMQEKGHIIHLLDLIRDLMQNSSDQANGNLPRLPSLTTLFFAHALRGIFYPSNFIYPFTARFLLQRPQMDSGDVPLLYNMLYSSTDNWRRECGWIMRFLVDGVLTSDDWSILTRRHTWDLLASMFQGSNDDRTQRNSIIEVLANLTCHLRSTSLLVHRSSLIHWVEMQLLAVRHDERIAWVKILENISVVNIQNRSGKVTESAWQNSLVRCLTGLALDSDVGLLRLISRVLQRLEVEKLDNDVLKNLMDIALQRLRTFEGSSYVTLYAATAYGEDNNFGTLPPHPNVGLYQPVFETNLETWGRAVENLWSVSQRYGVHDPTWDRLTSRLLVWRALTRAEVTPLGEWARTQALDCLSSVCKSDLAVE